MNRECGRHGKEREVFTILFENLRRKILFKDLGVKWRIICSRYLKKQDASAEWNFVARDTPTSTSFEQDNENSGSFKEFLHWLST